MFIYFSRCQDEVALKTIQLQEGDSSKTAIIGAGLGEK
jgi:hypothetical protein